MLVLGLSLWHVGEAVDAAELSPSSAVRGAAGERADSAEPLAFTCTETPSEVPSGKDLMA